MAWQPRKNLIRRWKGAVEPSTIVADDFVTNRAESSDFFDIVQWSKIRTSFASVASESVEHLGVTIPLYAWSEDNTGPLSHYAQNTINFTNAVGRQMVISCYFKPQARSWIRLGQNTNPSAYTYFDLSVSGTVGGELAGVDASYIEEVAPGIYRAEVVFTPTGVVSDHVIQIATGDGGNIFTGLDQVSMLMGGYQIEVGSRAGQFVVTPNINPITTERFITYGTPVKQTVGNTAGYSNDNESWFTVDGVVNLNDQFNHNGIYLGTMTNDTSDGYHYSGQVNQYTADATRRRLSVYCKMGTARYIIFTDRAPSLSNVQWSNIFDMQDGVWTFQGSLYVGLYEAEDVGDGVWRISFVSAVNSAAYDNLHIGIASGPTKEDQFYVGAGEWMYCGGVQVEYNSDASPGPLVKTLGAGTGSTITNTFGWDLNGSWKGAVEPSTLPEVFGLENVELDLPVGLENQVFDIQLVGSTILKIDEFNSSQVIVDREFAVKTELWNSNTTIKVD